MSQLPTITCSTSSQVRWYHVLTVRKILLPHIGILFSYVYASSDLLAIDLVSDLLIESVSWRSIDWYTRRSWQQIYCVIYFWQRWYFSRYFIWKQSREFCTSVELIFHFRNSNYQLIHSGNHRICSCCQVRILVSYTISSAHVQGQSVHARTLPSNWCSSCWDGCSDILKRSFSYNHIPAW